MYFRIASRTSYAEWAVLALAFLAGPSCSTNPASSDEAGGHANAGSSGEVKGGSKNTGGGSGHGGSARGGSSNTDSVSASTMGGGSASGGASNGGSAKGGSSGTAGVPTHTSGSASGGSTASGAGGSSNGGSAGGATSAGNGGSSDERAGGSGSGSGGSTGSGGSSGGTTGSFFPAGVTKPKIMIVGDSISAGPGCYKKYLVQNLNDNQITNYEFVGEYTDDCGGNVRHSAVSCSTTANFTQPTFTMQNCSQGKTFPGLSTLMTTHKPDMVMIQLGVNDVWGGNTPVDSVLANYEKLVQQARAANPKIVLAVAQIHKIITDNCTNDNSTKNAEALVKAVPAWAAKLNTDASPLFVADLWTNSDAHESEDCVHPNDAGAKRMGLNWYDAIQGILKP